MKKQLVIFGVVIAICLVLVGCGKKDDEDDQIVGGWENTLTSSQIGFDEKLLELFKKSDDAIRKSELGDLPKLIDRMGEKKVADYCGIGVPTLNDMVKELIKPGRDIRDELPKPELRNDILDINDLKVGMKLKGVVRNVIDFGAFIDIGVHQDGLVHLSQICDRYIKHPSEELTVGQNVEVKVIGIDLEKNRIQLSMRNLDD